MHHYPFPKIYNLNDVLPHIEGRDEFRVLNKGDYTVVKYMVNLKNTFEWDLNDTLGSAIRRECRGLIFNQQGNIVSRPFHKFFNCNEKTETQLDKINLYESHWVTSKMDGSMIITLPLNGEIRLATKAGITDTSENAEIFIRDKSNYSNFLQYCVSRNLTPIFEWCSQKNQIVLDYEKDNLVLLSVRHLHNGKYETYEKLQSYSKEFDLPLVPIVTELPKQNINLLSSQVREWKNAEGIVIWFYTGHRIKIKSLDYCIKHTLKEQITLEKNVINLILNDGVDDLVPVLSANEAKKLQQFQTAFWAQLNEFSYRMAEMFNDANLKYSSPKQFALNFAEKIEDNYVKAIMYEMKQGKGSFEIIQQIIRKNLISQTKVDKVRHLFGNLNWNYSET